MEHSKILQTELAPYLASINFNENEICWTNLALLANLWLKFGRSMNLSGARTIQGLMSHITEGIHVIALFKKLKLQLQTQHWLDVGSGAGFPALILLSSLDLKMTLIEPRENRATFLQIALATLAKSSCSVLRGRLDVNSWRPQNPSIPQPDFASLTIASARALFPVSQWVKVASSWLQPGSICICHMKPGDEDPKGYERIEHCTSSQWSLRAYQL